MIGQRRLGGRRCPGCAELGFDAEFDYQVPTREALVDGVDVYFDNVGGATLEAALGAMRLRGRIVACRAISRLNDERAGQGRATLFLVETKRLLMQGYIISDHYDRYPEFLAEMGAWVRAAPCATARRCSRGSSRRHARSSACSTR